MNNRVTLAIDGREASVSLGASILDAAGNLGVEIPTLCYEPGLSAQAQCRVCLVEVEGHQCLEPACATTAAEGMLVRSDSERALAARRMVLELLLSEHPRDCETRARGDECKLCDYAERFGIRAPSFGYGVAKGDVPENPFISRNPATCILCAKCVRACDEIQGVDVLAFVGRGIETEMRPALGKVLDQTDCVMCGNCVAVCPTGSIRGSLMSNLSGAQKVRTTCGYCGVGCQLDLNVRDGRVVGVTSVADGAVNGKWLCAKGRFGYEFIHHADRLTRPLIRRNGELQPASWDDAVGYVASRLTEIKARYGPEAIAFISSGACTNEENYLVQKIARAVIGTNSVDQCARH